VKFCLVCCLALSLGACTTLSNRRDLYNPSEDAGPYHSLNQKKPNPPAGTQSSREESLPTH